MQLVLIIAYKLILISSFVEVTLNNRYQFNDIVKLISINFD